MARKYRTAKGKIIDMEAMRTANEKTVASGNMKVNAKGDELGKGGRVVKTVKQRATERHQTVKQTTQASLKKPLESKETKINPEPKPEPTPIEEAEFTTETIRKREDGSTYKEVMTPEGDIDIVELDPPKEPEPKPEPKKKTKKKAKKSSTKKKPTV
jgi:hypothetical protein